MGELLHEEGITSSSDSDEIPQSRFYLSFPKDGFYQLSADSGRKLVNTDLAVVGLPIDGCIPAGKEGLA